MAWPLVLLAATPAVLTLALYHVVLTDVGLLWTADDAIFLALAEDGVPFCELLTSIPDHVLPLVRLGYAVLHALAGRWWPPYAWLLLLAFMALGAALGITIWSLTGSPALGVAAQLAFLPSVAMSSGVLTHSVYSFIFLLVALILAAVLLAARYARTGSRRSLAALLGVVAALLGIGSLGLLALPAIALVALAGTRSWRRLLPLGVGLALAALVMAGLILYGVAALGNVLVGQSRYGERPEPVVEVFTAVLAMGIGGVLPFTRATSTPPEIVAWKPALLGMLGLVGVGLGLAWRDRRARYGLAMLACLLLYAVIVANGRDRLGLWHTRYNIYAIVYGLLAVSCLLAVLLARLPRAARLVVLGLVLAGAAGLGLTNARAVRADDYYVSRAALWREARAAPGYDDAVRHTARSVSCPR